MCLTAVLHGLYLIVASCLIVKTDGYTREQVAKVVQLRANTEGLKLGEGVIDRLAAEGEKSSGKVEFCCPIHSVPDSRYYRYAIQLLTPAFILARLAGRDQIVIDDIGEMNELFLDAKTSASLFTESGDYAP